MESERPTPSRELGRQDDCPGILRLHAAADGYVARVRLPGGHLRARALAALADAACLGSDIVELTSRAGLQLRGLGSGCAQELASILARGGLLRSLAHDRVRNILAAPLAGRGPAALADVDGVVEALDRELCADPALAELPGRFLFAVDDGTRALGALAVDVALTAERDGERGVFRLHLDGLATSLTAQPAHAPEIALLAAHAFLALRGEDSDGAWRVGELPGGAHSLARRLGLEVLDHAGSSRRPTVAAAQGLGASVQRDGLFAVTVLPALARLGREELMRLAELARALDVGAGSDARVRVSPWRTLTFVDVPASGTGALLDELQELGLVACAASGWSGLSACAGLGACARARADVRAAAAQRALARTSGSPVEHWSGCERRCGEPASAGVRVVAAEHGLTVSHDGDEHHVATTATALELLHGENVRA